jgi:excisionase family DNA binding protein
MPTLEHIRELPPPTLSAKDRALVRVAQQCVMASLDHSRAVAITVTTDSGEQPSIQVPPAALRFIGQLLGALGEGRPVALLPAEQEFTTVEAANFLKVSRPFLIKELEANRLPYRKVGSHRRIALEDLMAYARDMRARQTTALEQLAANARALGLDY